MRKRGTNKEGSDDDGDRRGGNGGRHIGKEMAGDEKVVIGYTRVDSNGIRVAARIINEWEVVATSPRDSESGEVMVGGDKLVAGWR